MIRRHNRGNRCGQRSARAMGGPPTKEEQRFSSPSQTQQGRRSCLARQSSPPHPMMTTTQTPAMRIDPWRRRPGQSRTPLQREDRQIWAAPLQELRRKRLRTGQSAACEFSRAAKSS